MRRFDSGVSWYTQGTLTVNFPEDDVCCGQCPLCYEDNLKRPRCSFTNALVYSKEHISAFCPLIFDSNINEPVQQVDKEVLGVRV